MKSVFLETANVTGFRSAMAVAADMEIGQPGIVVATGRAGRGKTLCAREYAVRTGSIYLRALEDWTARGMLAEAARKMNGSEPATVDRCKRAACEEIEANMRPILVDEADRLNTGLIEHLRDIHDLVGVPVVLIGEEYLYPMVSVRRRLWSRVTQVVEFGPISSEDILLFGIRAAGLQLEPAAAQRIYQRSGGDFRLVYLDVHDLEQAARASGTKTVGMAMVDGLPVRKGVLKATETKPPVRNGGRRG